MNNYMVYIHKTPSNKYYIGITCNGINRWGCDGNGYKNNPHFYRAIQKYGWDNIEHIIIAEHLSKEDACEMEINLIAEYQSNNRKYGYNSSVGGEVNRGWHYSHSNESKEKISKSISEWHKQPEVRERLSNAQRGKKLSEEHKRKLSESHKGKVSGMKGKKHSEESRKKMSESQKKATKVYSEESLNRIREASRNHKHSEEVKEKIRQSRLGKKASDATRLKQSLAKKGKPSPRKGAHLSEETKMKISESLKKKKREAWM